MSLIESPVLDGWEVELIHLNKHVITRSNGARQDRRISDVKKEAFTLKEDTCGLRLFDTVTVEVYIGPASEPVF